MPSVPSFLLCRQQSLRSSFSHAFASPLHGPLVEVTGCATDEKLWVEFCVCSASFMFTIASDTRCVAFILGALRFGAMILTLRLLGTGPRTPHSHIAKCVLVPHVLFFSRLAGFDLWLTWLCNFASYCHFSSLQSLSIYVFISFMTFMTCCWDRKHYIEWDERVSQKQPELQQITTFHLGRILVYPTKTMEGLWLHLMDDSPYISWDGVRPTLKNGIFTTAWIT